MKKKVTIGVIAVVIIGIFVAIGVNNKKKSETVYVKTSNVVKGNIQSYLSTTGIVKSQDMKEYYGIQGKVDTVSVKVGDEVEEGDVLVKYQIQDLENAVKQAQLQYENAQLQLEEARNQSDNAQLPGQEVSEQKIKQLENSVELAKLGLEAAEDNASKNSGTIVATNEGIVTSLNVEDGGVDTMTMPAVVVQSLKDLKMDLSVGKYDASSVKLNQKAIIKNLGNKYNGKVSFIAPAAEKPKNSTVTDASVSVEIKISEENPDLMVGLESDVDILLSEANGVLKIPAECVKTDKNGKSYVLVVKENTAIEKQVTLGIQSDTEVQIIKGLAVGEKVVINPTPEIKEAKKVIIDNSNVNANKKKGPFSK